MSSNCPLLHFKAAFIASALVLNTAAWADQPVVTLEGDITKDLEALIEDVLGEVEAPARSLAQARRRAEMAATQTESVLRSQAYYGSEINARVDEFLVESKSKTRRAPQPILNIKSGPQFTFSDVSVVYDGAAPDMADEVTQIVALKSGEPAIADKVVAAELRAVNLLKANGYPDATARKRKAVVDHATAQMKVTYDIFIGEKTHFGEIEQTGTASLVKSWPSMIAPFESGDLFDDRKMNRLAARIIGSGVFDGAIASLSEEKIPNSDGSVTRNVLLNIEQGAINTVSGAVGFSTTEGSGVEIVYERRNFVGYAQTLQLLGTVKTNEISAGATYNIPFAWRSDREIDFSFEVAREDTDAFTGERVGGDVLLTQKFPPHFTLAGGISLEASRFEEDGVNVNSYLVEGLLKADYDTRNSLFDPEKGFKIEADITPSYNFGGSEGLFTTAEINGSTYKRVSSSLVAAGRLKLGTIFGASQSAVPLNRRFYGGGGGSVRGFGYQSISPLDEDGELIGGRSIGEASAEIRYRKLGSNLGFVGFVDAGSVTLEDIPTGEDIRYGAGVGVRYFTSFAPLRADVAIPINRRDGDNAVQVYISIGQAF